MIVESSMDCDMILRCMLLFVCCFFVFFYIFVFFFFLCMFFFFFQAEDGIRDLVRSRGLGDVYKRQDDDLSKSC